MIVNSDLSLHIIETTSSIETMDHAFNNQLFVNIYPYNNNSLDNNNNRVHSEVNEEITSNQDNKYLDEVQWDLMDYPYVTDVDRKDTFSMDVE